MIVSCKDLDRILERQDAAELAAMEAHAIGCDSCREQLALEREISAAARGMQGSWESPELWPRIQARLAAEPKPIASSWKSWLTFESWGLSWQAVAATAALALLAVTSAWLLTQNQAGPTPTELSTSQPPANTVPGANTSETPVQPAAVRSPQRLLTDEALAEVQRAETAYIASIERLSRLAAPKLQSAESPLLVNYREKLLVLDSAIAECRAQLDQNRFNAHLRNELLSIYQMKQATLTEVLQEEVR
jgi:hypothetical protein